MSRGLRSEGYAVDVVADGDAARIQAGVWDYDAIVLDVMLPERDGLEVCRVLRDRRCLAPVLMLTARGDVSDRIRGLDVGADDYLAKPFDFGELLARLRALTRRTPAERPARLEVGDLMVDPATHEVERLGTGVELTAREFAVTLATVDEGLVLAREPLDLDALTESVIEGVRAVADAREVIVDHQRVAVPVLADPDRLRHAIRNVVENAIKFSPAGGTVTVYTTRRGSMGTVAVEDEGPGIPAEHRERVFDRFYRVDAARTRTTGGGGLGLAITRDLVAAHRGAVWVDDGAHGAVVGIEVPAIASDRAGHEPAVGASATQ